MKLYFRDIVLVRFLCSPKEKAPSGFATAAPEFFSKPIR